MYICIHTHTHRLKLSSRWLPKCSRSPSMLKAPPLQKPVTIQNSTRTCRVDWQATIHCTVQNTMQNHCYEKQGDNTLFINSDQLLFTQQFPSRIIEVTIAFGWKDIHLEVKAFYLSWFKNYIQWGRFEVVALIYYSNLQTLTIELRWLWYQMGVSYIQWVPFRGHWGRKHK